MSLQIPVQKDIGEYSEKIVGKMSLRTLVCVSCGFAAAIGAACAVYFGLGVPVADATFPVMAAALPFWLAGFWRPFDMKLEEFLPLLADHQLHEQHIQYRPCSAVHWPPSKRDAPRQTRAQRRAIKKKGGELYEPSKAKREPAE